MALKDIWTNKTDDVDDILADDINAIANEVISNTENKADKTEIPTKLSELENDTNYVTNTDYATADVGGVVKVATSGNAYGIIRNSNNIIQISCAEKSDIKSKENYTRPITPINLDYAVEVCTNQTMSDDNTEAQGQLPASYNAVKTYVDESVGDVVETAENAQETANIAQANVQTLIVRLGDVETAIVNKADKTAISDGTDTVLEMAHNTETRFGETTELTLTLPDTITDDYISSVIFTSGVTATNFIYPDTIKMVGEGCIDGEFTPAANKRYEIIVSYDGASVVGVVGGYAI